MLKFKFLLWMMARLMQRAIDTNPACAGYVAGKRLEFRIQTADKIGRTFCIQDGQVKSFARPGKTPQFTLTFVDVGNLYLDASPKCVQPTAQLVERHAIRAAAKDFRQGRLVGAAQHCRFHLTKTPMQEGF